MTTPGYATAAIMARAPKLHGQLVSVPHQSHHFVSLSSAPPPRPPAPPYVVPLVHVQEKLARPAHAPPCAWSSSFCESSPRRCPRNLYSPRAHRRFPLRGLQQTFQARSVPDLLRFTGAHHVSRMGFEQIRLTYVRTYSSSTCFPRLHLYRKCSYAVSCTTSRTDR